MRSFHPFLIHICTLLFISSISPHIFSLFPRFYFTAALTRNIFLIPYDAIDRRKLGFEKYFNINFTDVLQQSKASIELFVTFI